MRTVYYRGKEFPPPPEGIGMLEWLQQKATDGDIKTNRPKQTKRLPRLTTMVANLAGTATDVLRKFRDDVQRDGWSAAMQGVTCCDEQRAARKVVCDSCPHQEQINNHERCVSFPGDEGCGCYLEQKRKLAAARCDQNKWDKVDCKYEVQDG